MTAFVVGPGSLGTAEAEWSSWPGLAELPAMDWGSPSRAVVVAPHPDDEVLGPGGSAAVLAAAGVEVAVVAVTDGEASHAGLDPVALAHRRREESREALRRLGLGGAASTRLGLPDGAVTEVERQLSGVLEDRLRPGDHVLAPWRGDGHPDHEATGRAAAQACGRTGAVLVEYPVWAWHWARPGDPAVPWHRARRVDLPAAVAEAKAAAAAAFGSQLEGADPVLPGPVLARLCRPFEVLLA